MWCVLAISIGVRLYFRGNSHFRVLTPLNSDQPPNPVKTNVPTLKRWSDPSRVKVHHYKMEVTE